ncbi:hypothetical protein F4777DRAFT_421830 [Nemania sp. FL0916]|nr:hypothetical protein F4777DRAFT_421830 [Nemania sp. FL0916]
MSTGKRKKLNIEDPPQSVSAFALRKKLRAQQGQVASPPSNQTEDVDTGGVATDPSNTPKHARVKARKTRTTVVASVEEKKKEALSQPSEPSLAQDPIELPGLSLGQADPFFDNPSPSSLYEEEERFGIAVGSAQPFQFSSFHPSAKTFRKRAGSICQLKLGEGERLVILGSYGIRIKSGEVTIYSATLGMSDSVSWVHAPRSHALPVIRCTNEATLELHPHPGAQALKSLELLSPLFAKLWWDGPGSSPGNQDTESRETFRILYTSEDVPKRAVLQDLKSPPEWNRETATLIASRDSTPSSIMITGPKSSGKSTFGRLLTNRFLTGTQANAKRPSNRGVVVLDLDPGQPEYCCAGQIALLLITKPVISPSFCRPLDISSIRTIRSHALASLSPASDPELYIEMALDLIAHYRNAFRIYPVIINMPGWIQGTGLDLLVSLIGELRPSDVIYMSRMGPADTVEALEEACRTTRFSTLPSQPSHSTLRTALHLRSMQTMAYFHAEPISQHNDGTHTDWFQKPLTAMAPWLVHFRGLNRGIFGILCYDFQTQPDLVADAINGTILAAVEVESAKAFRGVETNPHRSHDVEDAVAPGTAMDIDSVDNGQAELPTLTLLQQTITTLTAEGLPFIDTAHGLTLDPRYSRSLGLVLVRGIDAKNGDLHLLSPIATSQLEEVRTRGGQIVLVSGKFDPPTWAYTEDLYFQSIDHGISGKEGVDIDTHAESIDIDLEDKREDHATAIDSSAGPVPWIDVLSRNQKRGAGSKVWRVRRDLGRTGNPAD